MAARDTAAEIAFLPRTLKAPTLRESGSSRWASSASSRSPVIRSMSTTCCRVPCIAH